ncbi:hypothetical protein GF402_07395 [Candidatus Fermentibacteria bacterium]|nr:hypothetical protein [Candidatus Fermentibacteria bacterium]
MRLSALSMMLLLAFAFFAEAKPYRTVVESLLDRYWVINPDSADIDLRDYPAFLRPGLREYLARWDGFRSGLDFEACRSWVDTVSLEVAAGMERGIVALVDHPAARQLARSYASQAPHAYEWEGVPEVPLREVTHAMEYLSDHPDTPLEPFLLLLGAHRARAAWECYVSFRYASPEHADELSEELESTSEVYLLLLGKALSHPDPLVQWMAGELDDLPYVYMDVRDLLPDSVPARP